MKYSVLFSKEALKELKKLDKYTASLILGWVRKNLEGCEDPRAYGKGRTANQSGKWRYRVGNYRLLAKIQDKNICILIIKVGHRSEVYD